MDLLRGFKPFTEIEEAFAKAQRQLGPEPLGDPALYRSLNGWSFYPEWMGHQQNEFRQYNINRRNDRRRIISEIRKKRLTNLSKKNYKYYATKMRDS